jgi:peroxiredoxin
MYKRIKIVFLFIFIFLHGVVAQHKFFYGISVTAPKRGVFYVSYEIAGEQYKDSFIMRKGKSYFKKNITQPTVATISCNDARVTPLTVFLTKNNLQLNISTEKMVIMKSKIQNDFFLLTANDRIRPSYFPLYGELMEKNDTIGLSKISILFDSLKKDDIKKAYRFFQKNKKSPLRLYAFLRFANFSVNYAAIEKDFYDLAEWAKSSPEGKNIYAKVMAAKSIRVQSIAPPFTQKNTKNEDITLSNYRGKYVLLDFWASWCAPCRAEHPNLISTYNLYSGQGFEIISISLDSDRDAWVKAIEKDELLWGNISDLRGQENKIAIDYGIQAIPANFLIDPSGKIIDKDIRSDSLAIKLKKLLKR